MVLKKSLFLIFFHTSIFVRFSECNEPYLDILDRHQQIEDLSDVCKRHLGLLKNGSDNREIWAMKVLDVSGKKSSGFTLSNNFWLGNERACLQLNDPPRIKLGPSISRRMFQNATTIESEIPVNYRMFRITHSSRIQFDFDLFDLNVINIGLCFPKFCTDDDARAVGWKILVPVTFNDTALYGKSSFKSSRVLGLRDDFFKEGFVRILMAVLIIFLSLVIIGTCYTALTKKTKESLSSMSTNHLNDESCVKNDFGFIGMILFRELKQKRKIADKFWHCFALQKNNKFIMSSKLGKESLAPIHGIRTFGLFWIIIGHVYYYASASFDNLQIVFTYGESWGLQPFFAAALSVDSFFTISGLVLAYGFCEKQKKRPSRSLTMDVIKGTINRYLRITPSFMIIMLVAVTMSIIFNDTSQFIPNENMELNCKNYWWRNLLFIQNFYPISDMCMSWSWYVSTDFQLFIIASIILAISAKHMRLSALISLIFIATCSIYSGYVGIQKSFAFSLDVQYKSADELYTKPYTRAAQYLVGVWAGIYLSKINRQWQVRKTYVSLGWALSIFTLVFMVMIQVNKDANFFNSFMFPAFGRTLWSIAICFMVIAGSTEFSEGFIAKILNAKLLLPFSRMSFSAYILNPLVVMLLTLKCDLPFHLDYFSMSFYNWGFYVITYVGAYAFMLIFENPIIMFIRNYIE